MKKIGIILAMMLSILCLAACGSNGNEQYKEANVESSPEEKEPAREETEVPEDNREEKTDEMIEEKDEEEENTDLNLETDMEESPEQDLETDMESPDLSLKTDMEESPNLNLEIDKNYAELPESKGFEFESNGDGTCTLTKIGTCKDKDIVIPEKSPEGDTITMIAEYAFYLAEDIDTIVFAGRKMELDKGAFQSCEAKKIVITGSDLVVGESAFSYCEDVSEIEIMNSNLKLDEYAFYAAGKDMNVKILNCTGEIEKGVFQSCAVKDLTMNSCILEIGDSAFSYCEDLAVLSIQDSTLELGEYAFYDSGDDAAVTFENCGINAEDNSFQSGGLVSLNISGGDAAMGKSAFSYCEDLEEVILDTENTELGEYCFYDCESLKKLSIRENSKDDTKKIIIGKYAFQSCDLQKAVIGRGQIEIGDRAFSYCEKLVKADIKGKVSKAGKYIFCGCPEELVINYGGKKYNTENFTKDNVVEK